MTPEAWERVQELFARVRDLAADERERVLELAAREHPEETDTVRRLIELEPPSQFIEPVVEGQRAERFFGGGMAGTVLGDFRLEAEIGRGGMGVVYRAVQLGLDRAVAVKVLPVASLGREHTLERFRREAKAASALDHPRIVDVLAYGEDRGTAWFAMRWVDGHDLAVELGLQADAASRARCLLPAADGRDFLRVAVERVAELAEAVQHAHGRGIVHRDIKPQNILLDREGRMNLADFGLAKSERFGALSRTSELAGTPHYMSPEQVRALRGGVDHRTDVYSLGVVLYELLVRRRPFQADTPVQVMHAITHQEPRRPTKIDPSLPLALETICLRAMEKRARDRYASAGDLAADLRRWLRGEPIVAARPSMVERLHRRLARNPRVAVAAGASTLAIGSTLGGMAWYEDRADDVRLRVDLRCDVDPTGASVRVIEFDPSFRTRRAVRTLATWPVGWLRLDPGSYRCAIEFEGYGMAEVEFELPEPGMALERSARLLPRSEVLADMAPVPQGSVVLWHPDHGADGMTPSRALYRYEVPAFHLDVLPVTNRQYAAYLERTGAPAPLDWQVRSEEDWLDKPVVGLSLEQAQAFAEHAGKRLPTLAELQFASRGPTGQRFPWGAVSGDLLESLQLGRPELFMHEQFRGETADNRVLWYDQHVRPVGRDPLAATGPFGHLDLFGNVVVWTSSPELHFVGERSAGDTGHVYLGGVPCFRPLAEAAREGLDDRMWTDRIGRSPYLGLRCAVSARSDALDSFPSPTESTRVDSK